VSQYVKSVLSGDRIAGRLEKFAVQRYLDDQKLAESRGFYFNEDLARESCLFFPAVLRHSTGRYSGDPFVLTPFQAFCVWNIQGWRRRDDDFRRFRKAYMTFARKNGKTCWGPGS